MCFGASHSFQSFMFWPLGLVCNSFVFPAEIIIIFPTHAQTHKMSGATRRRAAPRHFASHHWQITSTTPKDVIYRKWYVECARALSAHLFFVLVDDFLFTNPLDSSIYKTPVNEMNKKKKGKTEEKSGGSGGLKVEAPHPPNFRTHWARRSVCYVPLINAHAFSRELVLDSCKVSTVYKLSF